MKKLHYALLASALTIMPAAARQLTPEEALQAATSSASAPLAIKAKSPLRLAYTQGNEQFKACYVFNRADEAGFIVVAADDIVSPILGYSENGSFDSASMPEGLRWLLNSYENEIAYAVAHPQAAERARLMALNAPARESVAPICTTLWNQDAPYNEMCPEYTSGRSVTGCVATAFAQVMKAHNYPAKGIGSVSYSCKYNNQTVNVSTNLAAHTYDWANMLDRYTSSSTDVERAAVAQLMFDAGAAFHMSYTPVASGAVSLVAAAAMITNFNYDKGMKWYARGATYLDEWIALCYEEVKAGRPVYYSGRDAEAGHAFVIDGYSTDNYFHVNWGWGGISNGYYLLSLLDPEVQGIGGGDGTGFINDCGMLIGCRPAQAGSKIAIRVYNTGGFLTSTSSYNKSGTVTFGRSTRTTFANGTLAPLTAVLGVKLVNDANGEVEYLWSSSQFNNTDPGSYFRTYSISASRFPTSGTYTVTPVVQDEDGNIYPVAVGIDGPSAVRLTCTSSKITVEYLYDQGETTISDFQTFGKLCAGQPFGFEAEFTTTLREFSASVQPQLINSAGSIVSTGASKLVSAMNGDPYKAIWITEMSNADAITPGNYTLAFVDLSSQKSIGTKAVTVEANPGELAYSDVTFSVEPAVLSGRWSKSSPAIVSRESTVKASFTVTSGQFLDEVYLGFGNAGGREIAVCNEKTIASAIAGETLDFSFPNPFDQLEDGETYCLLLRGTLKGTISQYAATKRIWFKVKTTGIEYIGADIEYSNDPVEYFNLQGMKIDNPSTGQVVIRRQGTQVTKQIFNK